MKDIKAPSTSSANKICDLSFGFCPDSAEKENPESFKENLTEPIVQNKVEPYSQKALKNDKTTLKRSP